MQKITTLCSSLLLFALFMLSSAKLQAQLKANFAISQDTICTNILDSFPNTSTGGTLPYTCVWDFGNTKTSTSSTGYANYSSAGTYSVKLRVTDAKGNKDSIAKTITVLGSPKADYSATKPECGVALYKAREDSSSQTSITKYLWVGQGSPGVAPLYLIGDSADYVYTRGGTYYYTLIVTGANGCSATYPDSIKMPSFPGILLPYDTIVCANATITIKATPSGGTPPYTIWWDNKSVNITGTTITPTITKDTAFAVHVLDSNNCYNYDSIAIKAYPLPNAHWTMKYINDEVVFHALDSIGASFQWTFGDGDIAAGANPKHEYSKNMGYSISLTVIDTEANLMRCQNSYDSTVNIIRSAAIETLNAESLPLDIYPNPFNSSTILQYTLAKKTNVTIELYDVTGKQVAIITNEVLSPGTYKTEINTDKYHLTQGAYLLTIITDDGFMSRQILKL